jgi:eukaryotic-like serine/threonine-protein kinase
MATRFSESLPLTAIDCTIPARIRHYDVRSKLGEGSFGQVYEAWDSKLWRTVAIKCIKQTARNAGHNLLREARLAAGLRHPAFVKIHTIEEENDDQSIVMEFIDGPTLRQLIDRGHVQSGDVIGIVAQLAQAMQTAHEMQLVHGDLKPANIIVEQSGMVRILDFGMAIMTDTYTSQSSMHLMPQGTIAYMAPERLRGSPPSISADIYALGVVLYELSCGARPFATLHGLALAAAQVQSSSQQWPYPKGTPTALIRLIQHMTHPRCEQRLADMQTVYEKITGLACRSITGNTLGSQLRSGEKRRSVA